MIIADTMSTSSVMRPISQLEATKYPDLNTLSDGSDPQISYQPNLTIIVTGTSDPTIVGLDETELSDEVRAYVVSDTALSKRIDEYRAICSSPKEAINLARAVANTPVDSYESASILIRQYSQFSKV
jgi:hypothetical protein